MCTIVFASIFLLWQIICMFLFFFFNVIIYILFVFLFTHLFIFVFVFIRYNLTSGALVLCM